MLATFELLVRPAINALLGLPDPLPAFRNGKLASSVRRNADRDELVRAARRGDGDEDVLEPLSGQESHMIVRPPRERAGVVEAGDGSLRGMPGRYLAI